MKAFWVQIIDLDLFFRYLKGRCHGNQFCEKMAKSPLSLLWHSKTECDRPIAIPLCALTASPVTLELTELICERLHTIRPKSAGVGLGLLISRIFPDVLNRFSQSFQRRPYMKTLCVWMMDLYLIFRFVKGRCHGN